MKLLILVAILFSLASVHLASQNDEEDDKDAILHSFEEWKKIYGKSYSSDEEKQRKKLFDDRSERIKEHNKRYEANEVTYRMGQNEYSDLTNEEFRGLMAVKHTKVSDIQMDQVIENDSNTKRRVKRQTPASYDWRTYGKVAGAQNQGLCTAGYAFAAVSTIESQVAIKCGSLYKFSEQQIIDCSTLYGNLYCLSGTPENSFRYLINNNGGLSLAVLYPYTSGLTAVSIACLFLPLIVTTNAKVTGFSSIPADESSLLSAVFNQGPIAVGMDVAFDSFQNYHSGIWDEPACSNSSISINHYMVVVGYGTDSTGHAYWTIKNSWGTSWGLAGFIKVPRNANNKCCVACDASVPIVSC